MEALVATVLVVVLIYLLAAPGKTESKSDRLDEYEERFKRSAKQFEEQYVAPRQAHIIELDSEIERYKTELLAQQDEGSSPTKATDIFAEDIGAIANDEWLRVFTEAEVQRAQNIKKARISAFEKSEGALLLQRKAELQAQVEELQTAKNQLIDETKTYLSMMEKLNESK